MYRILTCMQVKHLTHKKKFFLFFKGLLKCKVGKLLGGEKGPGVKVWGERGTEKAGLDLSQERSLELGLEIVLTNFLDVCENWMLQHSEHLGFFDLQPSVPGL